MERVEEFKVGDWVRIRPALTAAIHGLEAVTPGSFGIVYSIRPDSSLLLGLCYLSSPWHCEPEEVEPVEPFRVMRLSIIFPLSFIFDLLSIAFFCALCTFLSLLSSLIVSELPSGADW